MSDFLTVPVSCPATITPQQANELAKSECWSQAFSDLIALSVRFAQCQLGIDFGDLFATGGAHGVRPEGEKLGVVIGHREEGKSLHDLLATPLSDSQFKSCLRTHKAARDAWASALLDAIANPAFDSPLAAVSTG